MYKDCPKGDHRWDDGTCSQQRAIAHRTQPTVKSDGATLNRARSRYYLGQCHWALATSVRTAVRNRRRNSVRLRGGAA